MSILHKSSVYKTTDIPNPFQQGQDTAYADILLHVTKESNVWRSLRSRISFFLPFLLFCFLPP